MRKTLKEIAAIAEQMNNYAECVTIDGKEFKLAKNNIDNDEGWWYGGNITSKPNVYERDNEAYFGGKEQVLFFKFGYGFERENIARIIMTETDTYMVIDGKVYKIEYLIERHELVDDFDYEELTDALESFYFVLQNANGKYILVKHEWHYRPINYFKLKLNKACESISLEECDRGYNFVFRSNGKVLERIEF